MYVVESYNIKDLKMTHIHGVQASLQFGRKLQTFILNTCLPTILANLVGHTTNFINRKFFHVTITVNLTVMLVITTM